MATVTSPLEPVHPNRLSLLLYGELPNKEQKEKLREFTESIGEENSPIRESFIEKAKRFFK